MKTAANHPLQVNTVDALPYLLSLEGDELKCQWLKLDDERFTEPFFDETASRLKYLPENRERQSTSLNDMIQIAKDLDAVKPAVFIFHISRCGSTLVSQAFASSGRFIALSEVPFFDEILRLPRLYPTLADKYARNKLYTAAVQLYGLKRHALEAHVLIKTDCWHIFFHELLRNLFPDVPFILMYRNPAEVLRSLVKKPAYQIVPELVNPELFGLPGSPEYYHPERYAAVIIEKMLEKFRAVCQADANTILVNYSEGPARIIDKVAAKAGVMFDEKEQSAISDRVRYYSKSPEKLFVADIPADVPECILPALALYEQLEAERTARNF